MPLDPQARAFLDQLEAMGGPPLHQMSVPEARQMMDSLRAFDGAGEPVDVVEDRRIPCAGGDIPIRVYRAKATGLPLLVYLHGGGWVIGGLDSHDGICRALANAARCAVVSVDYRLAPEHPYPAAPDDAYAATRWIAEHAVELGGDPQRLAVGGDSAGGNLSAVTALMARDQGRPALRLQLLVYPATDAARDTVSYRENADGYLLTRDAMIWFYDHYLGGSADPTEPRISPLRARDLRGLPPAHVITAEFDPLRDEGEAYAARLREAGVPVTQKRYDGMIHGFIQLGGMMEQGRAAVADAAAALRRAFA